MSGQVARVSNTCGVASVETWLIQQGTIAGLQVNIWGRISGTRDRGFLSFFLSFFLSPTSFCLTTVRCRGVITHDHTGGHITVGRTPLDEGSARRRDLYLTAQYNTHNRRTSMPSTGFEPAIPGGERLQTHAIGIGDHGFKRQNVVTLN
jgi:hypothetical protein